ncbi:sodium/glutamate symporter [Peribacillus frigoritolerans]|uniref:sodium/glutamate symporter n=1 Tax=Peribacillus frigoritolerans TaxID=450367 RepID=UPI00345C7A42
MNIEINQTITIFLAILLLALGGIIVKNVKLFRHFCIPAPVIGGLLFAIVATSLKTFLNITISLDTTLQGLFMLTFFTSVGLGASFQLVKVGGKLLLIYWLLCGFLAFAQNLIGISLAPVFGIDPLIGMMAGAISMEGGIGAATAFGGTIESLGIQSAQAIGIAAATLGLVFGGLVGGPTVKYLINKHKLTPSKEDIEIQEKKEMEDKIELNVASFMKQVLILTFCMALGSYLGELFSAKTGYVLPNYVGAMIVAVIVRNILDKINGKIIEMPSINFIGDITLGIFLSMALMSIKLWEVAELALPIILIVVIQVIFIILLSIFIMFRFLGKNYDAAVMVGGFIGHGIGATPNAMANMSTITAKYGPSSKAYLIVPIVGAFLIDVFAMPIIIISINLFK